MATVMHMRWRGVTPEQYEQARRIVRWDADPAPGGRLHVAWFDDDALNVTDVWDSPGDFHRFAEERLRAGTEEAGIEGEPEVSMHPLHAAFSPDVELGLSGARAGNS